jgi:hypothetical protein
MSPLRRPKGVTVKLEQAIARGETDEQITRKLGVTADQVEAARTWLDVVNNSDEPGNCNRCGEPVRAVKVHHANGVTSLHRTCPNGHPHRKAAPNGRRLSIVRGER